MIIPIYKFRTSYIEEGDSIHFIETKTTLKVTKTTPNYILLSNNDKIDVVEDPTLDLLYKKAIILREVPYIT